MLSIRMICMALLAAVPVRTAGRLSTFRGGVLPSLEIPLGVCEAPASQHFQSLSTQWKKLDSLIWENQVATLGNICEFDKNLVQ